MRKPRQRPSPLYAQKREWQFQTLLTDVDLQASRATFHRDHTAGEVVLRSSGAARRRAWVYWAPGIVLVGLAGMLFLPLELRLLAGCVALGCFAAGVAAGGDALFTQTLYIARGGASFRSRIAAIQLELGSAGAVVLAR